MLMEVAAMGYSHRGVEGWVRRKAEKSISELRHFSSAWSVCLELMAALVGNSSFAKSAFSRCSVKDCFPS